MRKDLLEQPDFLFVISEFNFFKSHRLNLIRFLSTKYKSIVVATNLEEVTSEEIEKLNLPLGVKFQDYYLNRSSIGILSNFFSVIKLFRILYFYKPKRLFLVSSKPIIMGGICSLILPIQKVYFNISGLGYLFISLKLKARLLKKLVLVIYKIIFLNKRSKIIFQNNDDLDYFVNKGIVSNLRVELLRGNGVDTKLFHRKKRPGSITFLFASRLLLDKGIKEYLRAARSIHDLDVKFKVAGKYDKDNPNCLNSKEIDKLRDDSSVEYLEEIEYEQMPELFNSSDVFVLPSYREGLPKVALEAACSEMPLILSDVSGCRDCLIEGQTGFLVDHNSWSDIRDKMLYFIQNKDQIILMGKKSRQFVESNFSEKILFEQYDLLFKK